MNKMVGYIDRRHLRVMPLTRIIDQLILHLQPGYDLDDGVDDPDQDEHEGAVKADHEARH